MLGLPCFLFDFMVQLSSLGIVCCQDPLKNKMHGKVFVWGEIDAQRESECSVYTFQASKR